MITVALFTSTDSVNLFSSKKIKSKIPPNLPLQREELFPLLRKRRVGEDLLLPLKN